MAEINFPAWVTDDTPIPADFLTKAKKLVYTFVAIEKLRVLHNAGFKWARGDALDADEEALLAAAFPALWPTPPTVEQVRNWVESYYTPRSNAAQETRTIHRRAVTPAHFSYVELDDLI